MAIRSGAKALVYHNGKILLNQCRFSSGEIYYDLPGGGQNPYETLEEAVVREVAEETGYIVSVRRFIGIAEQIFDDVKLREQYPDYAHRVLHIFLVDIVGETKEKPTELDFQQEASVWLTPEEADRVNVSPPQLSGRLAALVKEGVQPEYFGAVRMQDTAI